MLFYILRSILSLTPLLEKVFSEQLSGKAGLLFDGWISGLSLSYVNHDVIHKDNLLALSQLINEEELGAQKHVIADNCTTSRNISNILVIPPLECSSHRFKLAVINDHPRYDQLFERKHGLLMHLCNLKNAARL